MDVLEEIAEVMERHVTEHSNEAGCTLACGYDGGDLPSHFADVLLPLFQRALAEGWSVGFEHGTTMARCHGHTDRWPDENFHPESYTNPYLAADDG